MDRKLAIIEDKEAISLQPDCWDSPVEAQKVMREIASLKLWTDAWQKVGSKVADLEVMMEFLQSGDITEAELDAGQKAALAKLLELDRKTLEEVNGWLAEAAPPAPAQ